MEREKQRQLDRDREMKERDEKRRQEKLLEQNVLMQFNATESIPLIPAKSKFVCIFLFRPLSPCSASIFFSVTINNDKTRDFPLNVFKHSSRIRLDFFCRLFF